MFVKNQDCVITPCEPGVTRKVMSTCEDLMMCEITFETGAVGNTHSHPHLQVTYIAEGRFAFTIDGETQVVEKGDSVLMPSNSVHGVRCLEAGKLVDVFCPMRKEFLESSH